MLAKRNDNRVECGKCGALLFKHIHIDYKERISNEKSGLINDVIEIKCKARKNGETCNELNSIEF